MPEAVRITRQVYEQMLSEVRKDPSKECCGLLAGRNGMISLVLPAENVLASATAFEIAPHELFELFRRMRQEALEHLGIFHSHPQGENVPSPSDIQQAYYPDAVYFILSPLPANPQPVRAFQIRDGVFNELGVVVTGGEE